VTDEIVGYLQRFRNAEHRHLKLTRSVINLAGMKSDWVAKEETIDGASCPLVQVRSVIDVDGASSRAQRSAA